MAGVGWAQPTPALPPFPNILHGHAIGYNEQGKMFDLPPLFAHAIEIVMLTGLSAIALGTGLHALNRARIAPMLSVGERLVFGLGLGYGVLAFCMLGMGLLGLIYLPVGLIVLAVLVVLSYRPLVAELRSIRVCTLRALRAVRYPPNLFLAALILLATGSALTKALVPVATQDDLMYHLALPRLYVEYHAVRFFPDSTYSLFPQLMEMLYTWGLLLGSDRLSVLFAFSIGLLGPVAGGLFAKRYLGGGGVGLWRALPLLVPALFLTVPLVRYVLRAANTDLAQASFDMLAVYAFCAFFVSARHAHRLLALSGLCAGLSFSVKYYGFAVGLAMGLALAAVLVWQRLRRERPRPHTAQAAGRAGDGLNVSHLWWFWVPFVGLAAPWLVRNYLSAGNPVWPLAGALLDGAYWSPQASPEELLGRAPGLRPDNIWTGLQFLWAAMTRPPLHIDGQVHAVNLGPLLILGLLALPLARWRPALGWVAYAAAAYWLMWAFFFSRTSIRYLSTFFLLSAVMVAYALLWPATHYRLARWVLGGVVALGLTVPAIEAALSARPYLPTVLATHRTAEERYLSTYMEDYPMMKYIQSNTPPDAVIYVWDGQPRGYYIPRRYVYARLVPLYTGFGTDPQRWKARLDELGITHVLVHERQVLAPGQAPGVDPFAEPARRFRERYFGPALYRVGDYSLHRLRD